MFLKNQSIQKRMMVSSLIVTLIPLLVLELTFFMLIQKRNVETVLDSASAYADQLEDNYQNELDELEHLAEMLAGFRPLETYLSSEFASNGDAYHYYLENIHPMLSGCSNVYTGIRVRIYHDRKQIRNFSFELNNGLHKLIEEQVPRDSMLSQNGSWTHSNIRFNTYQSVFSYYRPVQQNTWPYEMLYVVTVHMDENTFYTQIANEPLSSRMVLVTDKSGCILSSNQREVVGKTLEELPVSGNSLLQLKERERVAVDGREYFLIRRETEDLNIFYLVSYDSVYSAQEVSKLTLLVVGGVLMLLSVLLIVVTSREITEDIEVLRQKMLNIDRESIRTLAAYDLSMNSKNEIKQLDIVFTSMMGEIDILMNQIQIKERKLKDEIIIRQQAEIRALQHQIDPHYLFNTLEAIRMNLVMKDDRENAEIVKLFAESFRRYVDMREEFVSLLEEVEFIRKYIRIQNYRLHDKIRFTCIAEEGLLRYKVMKLLLQPLVENAVCHGVEQKEDSGEVTLRLERTEHHFEIFVEDDGVGMKKADLECLRSMVYSNRPGKSVGLQNIYQRVRLAYGEQAEMTIESVKGIGTRVRLTLPLEALEG